MAKNDDIEFLPIEDFLARFDQPEPAGGPFSWVPVEFSLSSGGYSSPKYLIQVSGEEITYQKTVRWNNSESEEAVIRPTIAQWERFRRALDAIPIWSWYKDFPNPGVWDGASWKIVIRYSDQALESSGDNNYPDAHGRPTNQPSDSPAYIQLWKAVGELIGKDLS